MLPSPLRRGFPRSSSHRALFLHLLLFLLAGASDASAQGNPAEVGRWGAPISTQLVSIHTVLLPTGKILYWDRHDQGTHDATPRIWDPATGIITKAPLPEFDLFCAGHSYLRNGDLLIAGGHIVDWVGVDRMVIYRPKTNTFDYGLPRMKQARWYPTNTTLPNGDVLITSGTYQEKMFAEIPEVYQHRTRTLRTLDSARYLQGFYPYYFVADLNRVFVAGPDSLTRFLDVRGKGRWTDLGLTRSQKTRGYGTAVMYEPGKILISGGGKFPPGRSAETIDLRSPTPRWEFTDSMKYARRHGTGVLLPDGTVAVFGGTSGPGHNNREGAVFHPEVWNPANGKWTLWAPNKTVRLYHSIALLLPDGRVLTGGGGHPGDEANLNDAHPDWEIFEPPYLFRGERPVIDAVPDTLRYGRPFLLSTRVAGEPKVALLRLAVITHAFDQNQDFNRLAVKRLSATGLEVTPPRDSVDTQPGPHLLFLLDAAGIPSLGRIVHVDAVPEPITGVVQGRKHARASLAPDFGAGRERVRADGRSIEAVYETTSKAPR